MAANEIPDFLLDYKNKGLDEIVTAGIAGMLRPAHISIKSQRFSLVDEQGNAELVRDLEIEVVVVGGNTHASRLYFGRDYDPTNDDPPKCWSDNGLAPSISAGEPQNPTCNGCPQSVWGSATSKLDGSPIPACQTRKKLAVLFDGRLYQLVVPPNSLDRWKKYAKRVAQNPAMAVNVLRTLVWFEDKIVGTLCFKALGYAGKDDEAFSQAPNNPQVANAGYTQAKDMVEFVKQHRAKGDAMLNTFTGNDDKPRTLPVPAAPVHLAQPATYAEPTVKAPVVHHLDPTPPQTLTAQAAQQQALTPQALTPQAPPPQSFLDEANATARAAQQAPRRGPGRPPKNPPQPAPVQPAPNGPSATAFGMVDTGIVTDTTLEQTISDAMNFEV